MWSDEFDGWLTKWNKAVGGNNWNFQTAEYLTGNNAITKNGFLIFYARKENISTYNYTTARIISKESFQYGYFESRMKIPSTIPTWPAFWLLSARRPLRWPLDGEIDIMEHVSCVPNYIGVHVNTKKYNWKNGTSQGKKVYINNLYDEFHTFGVDWNAQRIIFYIDNIEYFRYVKTEMTFEAWPFDTRFNIIFNMAMDTQCMKENYDYLLPAKFIVDYIRIYNKK